MLKSLNKSIFILDDDERLNFERMNFFTNFLNKKVLVPIFGLLPNVSKKILLKSSSDARVVHNNITSSKALDVLYNYGNVEKDKKGLLDKFFSYCWHHLIINAKGARNRLKIVKRELEKAVKNIRLHNNETVKIFSIASGSARAVIEVIKIMKMKEINIESRLLDLNQEALALSEKIAEKNGVKDSITLCHDKASNFLNYCENWSPDIVEMVGFLDYLNQDKAVSLISKIYNKLNNGGYLITANIIHNNEEINFLSKILQWEMIYRTKEELLDVLLKSGFSIQNCIVYVEPTLVHAIAVGKK